MVYFYYGLDIIREKLALERQQNKKQVFQHTHLGKVMILQGYSVSLDWYRAPMTASFDVPLMPGPSICNLNS